ncbi:LAME_0A04764g1_1 [Lachancea meyersii CBS 8951]|uniref:LAME_0A04764g1_1 n=1 Tax=Lachancea meyersii CBS 8951 TaxID=1266667 RepID=A0A1G4IPC9_9SACH|nr:LAME_0A04764g1_1 [Lachancea meyersii CBS 8951]
MHSETNSSPQQRIITSDQWVFDRRGTKDDSKTHTGNRAKRATLSKQEREMRRKQREIETEQLQQEYSTVQSENSRLKTVIAKLKQDIEVYTQLVIESSRGQHRTGPSDGMGVDVGISNRDELPPMETLLVNVSKRRKRGRKSRQDPPDAVAAANATDDDDTLGVLRNTQADVMLAPGAADVGPEEVDLMQKLKNVLAEME